MARTLQLESRADRVSFELDRFDSEAGERLEVSGRWFGVRGRRFVRPTLTLFTDEGSFRALADLEHKPWEPAEGGRWEAAFPWDGGAEVLEAELAVAPDVTIALPAPGARAAGRGAATKRGTADPKIGGRGSKGAATSRPSRRDELASLRDQLAGSRHEIERLRSEVAALRDESAAARAARGEETNAVAEANRAADAARQERDAAIADLQEANAARDRALAELEEASVSRKAALAARDAAIAAREQALSAREEALAGQDEERHRRERATHEASTAERASSDAAARFEQAQRALEAVSAERDQLQQALDHALRERDDAISARGAALVMRNATRAADGLHDHAGWLQRTAAVIVLVFAVFALLIVLHLL